jgi:thiol-disulfide isomerase/thioredoxin
MTKNRQILVVMLCAALALSVAWRAALSADDSSLLRGWMAQFIHYTPARPAPDTPFLAENGKFVTLQAFKGKVALVNFWATWCAPCLREMPSLDRVAATLATEDFLVAAVSIDRGGAKAARPFLEKLGVEKLRLFLDPKMALAGSLGVRGMPTTFLIDRKGRVVGALTGPAEWDSPEAVALIRSYLNKP